MLVKRLNMFGRLYNSHIFFILNKVNYLMYDIQLLYMKVSNAEEFHEACQDRKVINLQANIDLSQKGPYKIWSNMKLEGNGHTITTNKPIFEVNKNEIRNVTIQADIEAKGEFTIGGLVNTNDGLIVNCTVKGRVEADSQVGGIVGINSSFGSDNGEIKNCTSEATVTGDEKYGGIVGVNKNSENAIDNCTSNQKSIGKQE